MFDLLDGLQRSRKRKRKNTPPSSPSTRSVTATISPEAKDKSNDVPCSSLVAAPHTPKKTRRQKGQTPAACLVSTPIHSSSSTILPDIPESPTGAKQSELETTELCTQSKVLYSIDIHRSYTWLLSLYSCRPGLYKPIICFNYFYFCSPADIGNELALQQIKFSN